MLDLTMKHYFDPSSSTTHHDTQTRSDNGDDVSTVDSGVVTVKAANVKSAKMTEAAQGEHTWGIQDLLDGVDARVKNMVETRRRLMNREEGLRLLELCFEQFKCLLLYISPKSLEPNVQMLWEICNTFEPRSRKNRVLNLFLQYTAKLGISLPMGDFPNAFAVLNNPIKERVTRWTCYRAEWENTPEKRLKKMVKQFRENLGKAVTLAIDIELSKVMMSYLMFSIIAEQNSDDDEEEGALGRFVPLHEIGADGTGGTMFPKQYYIDNILLICERLDLNEPFINDCKRLVAEYFVPKKLEGSHIAVPEGGCVRLITNRRTGGSHSELTPNSFPQQRSRSV